MFAIKFSMKKRINFFWTAGFFLPAINATVFSIRTEKLHKMKLKKTYIFFPNLIIQFKLELSPQKGLIILAPARGVLADFWVPNEIDS